MPNHSTRTQASKTKKLSVKRILKRSKDKEDKQDTMGTETGNNATKFELKFVSNYKINYTDVLDV